MTILQSLHGYYGRMAARGDVVAPGWSVEPVGTVIVLAEDGSLVDVLMRLDDKGKKALPARVPKWFGRSGTGSTPNFLWDNTAYALGVSDKDPGKTARDHAAFRALHLDVLDGATDPGLRALRAFVETWTPERFAAAPFKPQMLAFNLAFRLEGGPAEFVHERPAAMELVERLRSVPKPKRGTKGGAAAEPEGVQCLITGAVGSVATLHTKIKGVNGTAAAEVPLVSFNASAFESYGKEQGDNAPVSGEAVARYGAALNALLDRNGSRNRLSRGVGDATVVFWADTSETVDEAAAAAAEGKFIDLFEPQPAAKPDEDEQEAAKLRDALDALARGRPVEDVAPEVRAGTRFHVLGLAPNAARLSVRYWLDGTFDEFARRLAEHHRDLRIEPPPRGWGTAPSVSRLLVRTTALQEKFENIPPLLAGEVMRAILTGAPYPRTLLAAAIIRLRAGDDPGSGWHAAVIKACLNRFAKNEKEMLPVALDPHREDTPYQLGRLFAVLESAQYAALGRVNATIGDRYYGAASATPARVFGPLLRGLKTHVSDARKRGQGGWIEPKVAEIMAMLPPELPRSLKLEEQGRFAIGYYHERGNRGPKGDGADGNDQNSETGDQ